MAATVRPVQRKEFKFRESSYLPEVLRGLAITTRQFWRNLVGQRDIVTLQYPEVKKRYPNRFRGRHRLMLRDDGQVRCVACMLCSTACPANCIHIVAAEHTNTSIEKFPQKFEIDLLVCIYCGFCEEACPCDAIRMDSGRHSLPTFSRSPQNIGKIDLMEIGSLSIAKQGGKNA
ncbi:MAG: NADH-quinone oxidoreductase subunit I [Myxococcales bacterium]|nr:NADH-quinone oxidoreductase subunit I [Myxococcales bacterium]